MGSRARSALAALLATGLAGVAIAVQPRRLTRAAIARAVLATVLLAARVTAGAAASPVLSPQ